MSDLEACYNRQLPNIGGSAEEHIGANRESIKHVTKVLPQCEIFLWTAYGVSKYCYRGINELLGGTGQGNVFSGSACRGV